MTVADMTVADLSAADLSATRNDEAVEPFFALPADLPAGETIVWQGNPDWRAIAYRVMHVRMLALYFGLLGAARAGGILLGGGSVEHAVWAVAVILGVGSAGISLLTLYAFLAGRSTVYTLTNKRVMLRCGVALPKWINIPLRAVQSADLQLHADGTGDLPLQLGTSDRIAYLAMWPNVKPWHFTPAQPMLRGLCDPKMVARLFARTLMSTAGEQAVAPELRPVHTDTRAPAVPTHAAAA